MLLHEITKSFDGKRVLNAVSHVFEDGSVTALMGPSGGGKTTLVNILLGLLAPDSGAVSGVPERVAAVFQEDRLLERQGALANVRFVCPKSVSDVEILALLSELGIDEGEKRVSQFSGGMRRRVAIARALIVRPELLVLDEPFKGLDSGTRRQTAECILRHRGGARVILVTHDPDEAALLEADGKLQLS